MDNDIDIRVEHLLELIYTPTFSSLKPPLGSVATGPIERKTKEELLHSVDEEVAGGQVLVNFLSTFPSRTAGREKAVNIHKQQYLLSLRFQIRVRALVWMNKDK